MTTLLAEHHRRAAHGNHRCEYCRDTITTGDRYLDQRIAGDGRCYTFKAHHACHSAYWSWVDSDCEELYDLFELNDGHTPPCWHAWNHDIELWRPPWTIRFIGPPPPCTCDKSPASSSNPTEAPNPASTTNAATSRPTTPINEPQEANK